MSIPIDPAEICIKYAALLNQVASESGGLLSIKADPNPVDPNPVNSTLVKFVDASATHFFLRTNLGHNIMKRCLWEQAELNRRIFLGKCACIGEGWYKEMRNNLMNRFQVTEQQGGGGAGVPAEPQ